MNIFHLDKCCQLITSTTSGTSDFSESFHFTSSFTCILLMLFEACNSIYQRSFNFLSLGPLSLSISAISKEGVYTLKPCVLAKDMASRVRLSVLRLPPFTSCVTLAAIQLLLMACSNSYGTMRVAYSRRLLYTQK